MKFVHNFISTKSNPPTLSDIIKAAQTKVAMAQQPQVKTAQVAEVLGTDIVAEVEIVASKTDNFGDKKAPPFGKKDEKKDEKEGCNTGGKGKDDKKKPAKATVKAPLKKAEADEAESSGQLEEKANPQNDPKVEEGEGSKSSGGKKSSEGDEAESSGQLDPKANPNNCPEVKKDAKAEKTVKTAKWYILANLTKEQKSFVREELEKFWPKNFVDALLADR